MQFDAIDANDQKIDSDRLDQPFEDRSASSKKNSELLLEDNKKETSNEPSKYIFSADVNPKNILLDIQPIKIMDQNKELETSKDFYEDFGNDRYKCFKNYVIHYIYIYIYKIYIKYTYKIYI